MATRAEVEQAARALRRVSDRARADLRGELVTIDPTDRVAAKRLLDRIYPEVVATYGAASAALGADMVQMWAADMAVRATVAAAPPANATRAAGVVAWALTQPDWQGQLNIATDAVVKQPYRDTVQESARRSRVAWARVPTGPTTCSFCIMTASRGAVYHTAQTAGSDRKFHGDCDCAVVMVRGAEDYPEGYDPQELFDIYDTGWSIAVDKGHKKPTTKQILAGMREATGLP